MIGPDEIAALAALYDRYANALERTSPDRLQAGRQFHARLEGLYQRRAVKSVTMPFGSQPSNSARNT
jgi:hypothetical protein